MTRWIALAVALAACAPTVIWSGHTADRRHTVEVVREGDHQRVVVDGIARTAAYSAVAAWSLETAGARVAYAARLGNAWVVVDAGRPSPRWDGIGELVLAGEHTAYVADRAGRWHVVVDGVSGPGWDAVLASTLRFSPDHAHVAYAARDRAGVHVVIDGAIIPPQRSALLRAPAKPGLAIGPAWDGVAELAFSADGAHSAYVARSGQRAVVVVDGAVAASYLEVRRLHLVGARPIYAARDAAGWHAVAGEPARPSEPYRAVRAIVATADHLAWVARDDEGDLVTCDGEIVGRARAIDADRFAIVDGCDVVYATSERDGVHVIRGASDLRYDAVGALVVSATGHVAFAARIADTWFMVIDGQARRVGSYAGDPVFSADGTRLAYIARREHRWLAVVDDHAYAFDLVIDGSLAFSRNGRRWAVIAGDLAHEQMFFAIDGSERVPLASAEIYSAGERAALHPTPTDDGAMLRAWTAAEADKR